MVNEITFQTGGWDAEYGNKNAAIVNVNTRVPAGDSGEMPRPTTGSFAGNGQTRCEPEHRQARLVRLRTRQATDMRREPVVFDTLTGDPINFHNHGVDLFTFGKLQYLPTTNDVVNLDLNWSRTRFEVPYRLDGREPSATITSRTSTASPTWAGGTNSPGSGSGNGSELFVAAFHRRGSLAYTPGVNDIASFVFFPDTTPFNLTEDRNFNTTGLKADYTYRLSEHLQFKTGGLASFTRGHEDFTARDQSGAPGPASNSDLKGSDQWVYAQTVIAPSEQWELRRACGTTTTRRRSPAASAR